MKRTVRYFWLSLIGIFPLFLISCTPHFRWEGLQQHLQGLQETRGTEGLPGPYQDFAGSIHVHTELSHDSEGTVDEIVEASRQAGSRFVITTDHHGTRVYSRGFRGWVDDFLVIRGSEIIKGCRGTTGAGCNSLLVLGLEDHIDTTGLTMQEVVEKVKRMGGLAFAAHPDGYVDWQAPIDGMEIYDILDDAVEKKWKYPKWFFDVLYSFKRYPDLVFMSILDRPDRGVRKWDELTREIRIVAIAGNDAHQNIRFAGMQIDPYDLTLRFVRTHVLASALNEEEILAGLSAGHAYVSFDVLSDATGFGFWAEDDAFRGIMGDEIKWSQGLRLRVQTPIVGRIQVVRDGKAIKTVTARSLTLPVDRVGVYRIEVSLPVQGEWMPWIYSNPIYLRAEEPLFHSRRNVVTPIPSRSHNARRS